ncbi:glycosyltransferase family 2 protein [Myxococcaceae bacterium JPH2]|nr:glycosyltransferase family 2 protein [Myxococcaceae bacterium JPH2]
MTDRPTRSCDQAGACVVIPVYNHARTVGAVVRGSLEHASTVLVCDDGSTDGSGDEAERAGATVLRQPQNRGKGVALRRLLDEAHRRGFRSAIALDADGQHLPSDLPTLAAAVTAEPGALIIGARDLIAAGAPASSEFGRKFSNFWVWFESGARVEDSQSGFRAYPLAACARLPTRNTRYDFEVEILLRAAWAGVPLRSVPIGVIYPKDRISHFRPFVDNARISLLNTLTCIRLFLPLPLAPRLGPLPHRPGLSLFALRRWAWLGGEGLVWRALSAAVGIALALGAVSGWGWALAALACAVAGLGAVPALAAGSAVSALLGRGLPPLGAAGVVAGVGLAWGAWESGARRRVEGPRRWTGRSRGGVLGHWFFFQVTRVFGIGAAYAALYPVAFYFLLTSRAARQSSAAFLDRAVGPARGVAKWRRAYQHILSFARTLVDRALLSTRGRGVFRYEEEGIEHIRTAATSGKGAVLLTAHLGNWDVAAGLLGQGSTSGKLAIVAFRGEQERLSRFLEKAHGKGPRVIAVGDEFLGSLEMVRALREGTLLAVQGDRATDRHFVRVPFLGREAPFPVGPFMLAAVSGAPIITTFSLQVAPATYRFFARPPRTLAFVRGVDRDAQLRAWVEDYVRELESVAREYPYQWFNFYDFWDAAPPAQLTPAARPPPKG